MQNPNPTFIKLFENDERGTEYIAITTITKVHIETKRVEGSRQTEIRVFTLEGAQRIVTGADAEQIISTLDRLCPGLATRS